jgi:hypothetical protein
MTEVQLYAGISLTERRRSRTYPATGCAALPVLKTGWATGPRPLRGQRSAAARSATRTAESREGVVARRIVLQVNDGAGAEREDCRCFFRPVLAAHGARVRDEDDLLVARIEEVDLAFTEALLVPLAKSSHDLVAVLAVPLAGLPPAPSRGGDSSASTVEKSPCRQASNPPRARASAPRSRRKRNEASGA